MATLGSRAYGSYQDTHKTFNTVYRSLVQIHFYGICSRLDHTAHGDSDSSSDSLVLFGRSSSFEEKCEKDDKYRYASADKEGIIDAVCYSGYTSIKQFIGSIGKISQKADNPIIQYACVMRDLRVHIVRECIRQFLRQSSVYDSCEHGSAYGATDVPHHTNR